MNKRRVKWLTIMPLAFICIILFSSWGVWGHKHINRAAVFALPDGLRQFFYNHIDYVTNEAIIPDVRKYLLNDKAEFPRHYINIEAYNISSIDSFPKTMKAANVKWDSVFMAKNGILPWYIIVMTDRLTKAFKEKNKTSILLLASDLGHYLGDAHMPLHTSLNHDGQLTNQSGIHAFWESQLPEMYGDTYNLYTGNAKYIDDITKETWRIIKESHALADTLLLADRTLKLTFPDDKIYTKDDKGNVLKNKFNNPIHSKEYAEQYNKLLNGMVEKQLRLSIAATANYWYTAWVNAGKPDLSSLDDTGLTKQNEPALEKDLAEWKKGKLILKAENEF